jgi:hypothetical protein
VTARHPPQAARRRHPAQAVEPARWRFAAGDAGNLRRVVKSVHGGFLESLEDEQQVQIILNGLGKGADSGWGFMEWFMLIDVGA